MSQVFAIVPAGGMGVRFGGATKKQYLELDGQPLLARTVKTFLEVGGISRLAVVLPQDDVAEWTDFFKTKLSPQNFSRLLFVAGGSTRSQSVHCGFVALQSNQDDLVLIHDAVRPLVSKNLIEKIIEATQKSGAVIPALPLSDTIKQVTHNKIEKTLDRNSLCAAQTPQGFKSELLKKAYQTLPFESAAFTDEASLVEALGVSVSTIEGEKNNIKITNPLDLNIAKILLS